jgi:integrase/recombinase XerD
MFDHLFKSPSTIALHATAPYAEERSRYLNYCTQRGDTHLTVLRKAWDLIWVARTLPSLQVTIGQIQALMFDRSARDELCHCDLDSRWTRRRIIANAHGWLRYLGCLHKSAEMIGFQPQLDEYCRWATHERGLSESTIRLYHRHVKRFLRWYELLGRPLSRIHVNDVDAYLSVGSEEGWQRLTIRSVVDALRAFLRFAAEREWCQPHVAAAIRGPRIYALEKLPSGPTWAAVERLFAGLDPNRPRDVRDRPILMLFAIYGMRTSEVAQLRLDDIDWESDQLHVRRAKRHQPQVYPLLPSVGKAIAQYLQTVRHASPHRQVFLTLVSPYAPLSLGGLYSLVSRKLMASDVHCAHHGPHALRHACAARLVSEGFPLKEIGDHLGHRSTAVTRIYAKVDLPGLREVAAFDLGELS